MLLRHTGLACCALLLTLSAALARAQIKTDGSLGAKQTLTGPNFAIPATLGRQAGGNLFHSFSDFNIQAGESATFSGTGSVHNVLARVTGGTPSTINGALRCDIPGANLYLMNPSGVVFGPGATLDLSGSFAVTSADSIRLGKSTRFNATRTANEVLTSAAPTAFGFLAARPGPSVALVGSQLSVNTGKTLSIISNGNIAIASANLSAPAGRVNLVAAASKGQVGLRATDVDSPVDSSLTKYADIAAAGNTVVNVSGDPGGRASIRANDLSFDSSGIASLSTGSASPARSLDIDVAGRLSLTNGAALDVSTLGQTRGGNADIHAHKFNMSGASKLVALTGGAADAGDFTITAHSITLDGTGTAIANGPAAQATGNGGNVALVASSIALTDGAQVLVGTLGSGNGGVIRVQSDDLAIQGNGTLGATGLLASSDPGTAGAGGDISIRTGTLRVSRAGLISVETAGSGPGGNLDVTATSFSLADENTFLLADTRATAGGGPAGSIRMDVASLDIGASARIVAGSFGDGRGGNVTIRATENVLLHDPTSAIVVGTIAANGGRGGDLDISAPSISIQGGANVVGATSGSGNAGTMTLTADTLSVSGSESSIRNGTDPGSAGNGGDLIIRTGALSVTRHGAIIVGTQGSGNGGTLDVRANDILIRGMGAIRDTGLVGSAESGSSGRSGNIAIRAGSVRLNRAGIITVETSGTGPGGSISVDATSISLDGAKTIVAADATGSGTGTGGTLTLTADSVSVSGDAAIFGGTFGAGAGGKLSVDAKTISINEGALIFGGTVGSGSGGDTQIQADSVTVTGPGSQIFVGNNAIDATGSGGRLTLRTQSLTVTDGAVVSASTIGSGNGGSADITAHSVLLRGRDGDDFFSPSTAIAVATDTGAGQGGTLTLTTSALRIENGAAVGAGSGGPARGGDATIVANNVVLDRGGILAATIADKGNPIATGNAGSVRVTASESISLRNHSQIGASSEAASAGSLTLSAPRITLNKSQISANAALTGGSINVSAHDLLYLYRSQINAVGQQQIGSINIDPIFTVLDHSSIMTTTDVAGGNINVRTDRFFKSADSFITAAQNATVTLTIYTPYTNITGSLVPVNAPLIDASASFIEECSRRLQTDLSSFLITGRGAVPVEPGGLNPSFDLTQPSSRPR